MIIGYIFTQIICRLHEQHTERKRLRQREERGQRAAREREEGWQILFDHMAKRRSHPAPLLTSQPVALTAREAALEAKRDEALSHKDGAPEPVNMLPLGSSHRGGFIE